MFNKYFKFVKSKWFIAVCCLLAGAAIVLGIRFYTYKPETVHYHANFALYINGQKEQFKGPQYYSEAAMCVEQGVYTPVMRAHMHDNVNNVIHVEDHAVTWGDFFANMGWTLGATNLISPDGTVYTEDANNKLHLSLNGQDYTDFGGVQNFVIHDKDKLLLSYGDIKDSDVQQEYNAIPGSAQKYDVSKDSGSCGSHGGVTMHDRLNHLF